MSSAQQLNNRNPRIEARPRAAGLLLCLPGFQWEQHQAPGRGQIPDRDCAHRLLPHTLAGNAE